MALSGRTTSASCPAEPNCATVPAVLSATRTVTVVVPEHTKGRAFRVRLALPLMVRVPQVRVEVVPPARHADQVGRVAEALYRLQPELAESDYTGAFAEVVARYRRRAMLVVLTDLNEQAVLDSVLPALPLVTRTHLVVVAAVQALADRERTTVKLRALGATVVDAEPGRLGVEVTDAYLAAKSSGRL